MVESRADHNEICCVHATSKSHACTALLDRIAGIRESETKVEFTALFLAATITMVVVWRRSRPLALNVVSTLSECGFGACADNPVAYELLRR
jgi:CHASE2 domain-containing sensor protein